jgi:acyl-CoA thioester hydrolase
MTAPREAETIPTRADYPHVLAIPTRWMDNDVYGHVNNVTYYSWFDTVVNAYLIDPGGLDIHAADVIGVVAESGCRYRRSIAFPEVVEAGLRVDRLGNTSVRYGVGLFVAGDPEIRAWGHFVHVFVDRASMRPTPIPDGIRAALQRLAAG